MSPAGLPLQLLALVLCRSALLGTIPTSPNCPPPSALSPAPDLTSHASAKFPALAGVTLLSQALHHLLTAESRPPFLCLVAKASCGLFPTSDPPWRLRLSFFPLVLAQIRSQPVGRFHPQPVAVDKVWLAQRDVHLSTDCPWCFPVFTRAESSHCDRHSTAWKA